MYGNPYQILNMIQMAKINPQGALNMLMQGNPQFAQFYQANKDKPLQQVAQENGIDIEQLKQFLK